jgi:hypothetical protein
MWQRARARHRLRRPRRRGLRCDRVDRHGGARRQREHRRARLRPHPERMGARTSTSTPSAANRWPARSACESGDCTSDPAGGGAEQRLTADEREPHHVTVPPAVNRPMSVAKAPPGTRFSQSVEVDAMPSGGADRTTATFGGRRGSVDAGGRGCSSAWRGDESSVRVGAGGGRAAGRAAGRGRSGACRARRARGR